MGSARGRVRDPPKEAAGPAGRSARAADGLRSQSKIAPQESPVRAWGDQCFARPPDEDAIWQSEVSLNGGRWGHGHEMPWNPTCL